MKVLVLSSTYPRWPDDTLPPFVHELARRVIAQGIEVDVLTPHHPGALSRETWDGVQIHRFRYAPTPLEQFTGEGGIAGRLRQRPWRVLLLPAFVLGSALALYRKLGTGEYSLVHAHWLIPQGVIAAFVLRWCRRRRLPLLCTSHGGDLFALRAPAFRWMRRWLGRHVAHLAVVSEVMRQVLTEEDVARGRISVMPMGVDLVESFVPRPDVPRQPNRILFVGRLVEKKGVHVLLEAFAAVRSRVQAAELRIIGDGPERPRLQALASTLGLDPAVVFVGARTSAALPAEYSAAAIAAVPSIVDRRGDQEGLGLVTIEAMGCGCAIVASDLQAIRDVVIDERNGLLARAGDRDDLARQLERLLVDTALRESLTTHARGDALARFDWRVASARYVEMYTTLNAERVTD